MIKTGIGFLGAGNMAEALIRGLLATQTCRPDQVMAADVNPERLAAVRGQYGIATTADNRELAQACPTLLLAVKPQQAPPLIEQLRSAVEPERHLLISIAAGLTTAYLEDAFGFSLRVIRAMPNTPAKLRAGATAFCLGQYSRREDEWLARDLFSSVGLVVAVEEALLDAVTAVSGSGPAYVFYLCELMISAGRELGLQAEQAEALAVQTVWGAARMLAESGQKPEDLRAAVTSAGGTTEAALRHLQDAGFAEIFTAALQRAKDRARALTPPSPGK